jgi:hypothetical protein
MKLFTVLAKTALFFVIAMRASLALAYTANNTCSAGLFPGTVTWASGNNVGIKRDTCSMPDGNQRAAAWSGSTANWLKLSAVNSRFSLAGTYNNNCTIQNNNGVNEAGIVSRSSISGNAGLTVMIRTGCITGPSHYTEGDVMIADDMDFSNEDESFWRESDNQQGQVVMEHELGHFIVLGHSQGFDIMRTGTPEPLVGGTDFHGAPYPDDANGIRNYYCCSSEANVFASAVMLSGGTITATGDSSTFEVCRGGTVTLNYTVGNSGNQSATVNFRIYLTTNLGVPTGGINLWSGVAVTSGVSYFTETNSFTVPTTVPNGLYFIQWQLDDVNSLSEYDETDNFVHSASTVLVDC